MFILGTSSLIGGAIYTSNEIASYRHALRQQTEPKKVFLIFTRLSISSIKNASIEHELRQDLLKQF
jgi:RNase P/RNase MRP subunit POP5